MWTTFICGVDAERDERPVPDELFRVRKLKPIDLQKTEIYLYTGTAKVAGEQ